MPFQPQAPVNKFLFSHVLTQRLTELTSSSAFAALEYTKYSMAAKAASSVGSGSVSLGASPEAPTEDTSPVN